jgi:hypothetical protein
MGHASELLRLKRRFSICMPLSLFNSRSGTPVPVLSRFRKTAGSLTVLPFQIAVGGVAINYRNAGYDG